MVEMRLLLMTISLRSGFGAAAQQEDFTIPVNQRLTAIWLGHAETHFQ